MTSRNRNRFALILVALLFAMPFLGAIILNSMGWRPLGTRNFGELVQPPQNLTEVHLNFVDGAPLLWKDPQWQWTLLALPSRQCAQQCLAQLDELRRVRLGLNQKADRVRVIVAASDLPTHSLEALKPLHFIHDPDEKLASLRSAIPDSINAAIVDPNGFLVLRYAAGYDGNGLRKDITRLIR